MPADDARSAVHSCAADAGGRSARGVADSYFAHRATTKLIGDLRGETRYGGSGGDRLPPLMSQPEKKEG